MTVAAGCQRRNGTDDHAKALAECDSTILVCTDSLSSENILMIDYQKHAALIDELHEAYVKKERLLEERIVGRCEGSAKLLLYQEFERSHRFYNAWAEQNDSLIYATHPFGAPWIECRCQRIDKLTEHIKILETYLSHRPLR